MIKFHCESCQKHQDVIIEDLKKDDLNDKPWSDIVCKECKLVIATISAEEEGSVMLSLTTSAVSVYTSNEVQEDEDAILPGCEKVREKNFWSFIWNLSESSGIGLGRFAPFVFERMMGMVGIKGKRIK